MLLNLKTIHKPSTLGEALLRLREPGTFPLYGGAALQRSGRTDVAAVVDLSRLELGYIHDTDNNLRLGSMLTLEEVRQACQARAEFPKLGAIAGALAADMPETQRHTLTLGDLLMERNPQSLTLTTFLALGGVLKRQDVDMHFTAAAWLSIPNDVARYLIAQIRIPRQPRAAAVAWEKVARTPADAPIVAAVACIEKDEDGGLYSRLAICGAAPTPVPQPETAHVFDKTQDVEAALDKLVLDPVGDHWGSAEYRAAMARVTARRALLRALAQMGKGHRTAGSHSPSADNG